MSCAAVWDRTSWRGGKGSDTLNGDEGADTLSGGLGDDLLRGGFGADSLKGGSGRDTLDGGKGNDFLNGGPGSNTFIFEDGNGNDTIVGFDDGADLIDLTGHTGVTSFADLTITQLGNDLLLQFDANDSILLDGFSQADLGPQDFIDLPGPPHPAAFNLSALDGVSGFRIDGTAADDFSGVSVSGAGDINGDGFADVVIGATGVDTAGGGAAGAAYVVFGSGSVFASSIDLSALDGSNGFRLDGTGTASFTGGSVSSAGDVNGDGIDDLIVGTDLANTSYVVFGSNSGFASNIELSTLDGSNGFRFGGIDSGDRTGSSVSGAGDVNGDGFDDLIAGAPGGDAGGNLNAGESFVVFGSSGGFAPRLGLTSLDGNNGFRLDGIDGLDRSGRSVSGAGDINGDGLADVIIGAYRGDPNGNQFAGQSFVIFGSSKGFSASLSLSTLDGSNGFRLDGIVAGDETGISVSGAGDVNGDGIDDLIIGASRGDPGNQILNAGQVYVVFGSTDSFAATVDLADLDGTNGFRLNGIDIYDLAGIAVDGAGDFNGDGLADMLIGASRAGLAGESYVVFGSSGGFASNISLSTLDGSDGFRLDGVSEDGRSGASVSNAGDVNGDGYSDLIIGAFAADPSGNSRAGESYVVFGGPNGPGSAVPAYNFAPTITVGHLAVLENSAISSVVGSAVVNDLDAGDTLTVSITRGNEDGAFAIDNDGEITVAGTLDHENLAARVLTIEVTDSKGYVARTTATIAVRDLADGFFAHDGLDLQNLNGANGFRIDGVDSGDNSGRSVSDAGDVNGDGIDDLIVGADGAGNSGSAYVLFGSTNGFASNLDLSALDGNNGFRLDRGLSTNEFGYSVSSAGDVNGDGIDDLIVGAPESFPNGISNAGSSYVVFGSTGGFASTFNIIELDGGNGFRITGIDEQDRSGISVSGAGDVNGDGLADVIIGATRGDPNRKPNAGESYVVFGSSGGFASNLNLSELDGSNGFRLAGISEADRSGISVGGAGDVNGDGLADVIIGAYWSDAGGNEDAGESYVVFGSSGGFASNLNLSELDGSNRFRLRGIDADDYSGFSVSGAGDVNNDGIADIIIGARRGDPSGIGAAGESYVVFGSSGGFASNLNLSDLDGNNGFRIDGIGSADASGASVSSASDVNGDGITDIIIGAPGAERDGSRAAGEGYVVFGSSVGFSASLDLSELDGTNGFRIDGISIDEFANLGRSVSGAGDINADGLADIIIGAHAADPLTPFNNFESFDAGESYVIFGRNGADKVVPGTLQDDVLVGGLGDDTLSGFAGADRFVISEGDDTATDFTIGEDVIGLEGLLSGVQPADIGNFVELTNGGPNAQLSFDDDGLADFSAAGREGTLSLLGVDFTGNDLGSLLDDGTIWLG